MTKGEYTQTPTIYRGTSYSSKALKSNGKPIWICLKYDRHSFQISIWKGRQLCPLPNWQVVVFFTQNSNLDIEFLRGALPEDCFLWKFWNKLATRSFQSRRKGTKSYTLHKGGICLYFVRFPIKEKLINHTNLYSFALKILFLYVSQIDIF